jgi:hypothetical protein
MTWRAPVPLPQWYAIRSLLPRTDAPKDAAIGRWYLRHFRGLRGTAARQVGGQWSH